jgi:hypothetical protein
MQNNADQYPADDIVQNLPQIDPQLLRLPQEAATAANWDSVIEGASMLQFSLASGTVVEEILNYFKLPWPKLASEFQTGFFFKSFPDLFPDGRGEITKTPGWVKTPPST